MEDINNGVGAEVKETFTRAEVDAILANQEKAFYDAAEHDSRVRFRAQCIVEVIKNHEVLHPDFVAKAAQEFEEFLYPHVNENESK